MTNQIDMPVKQSCISRRKKIWSIEEGFICSVIGTCLRRSELRKMARKKQFGLDSGNSDYELHSALINQVSARNAMSRALSKMLDKKYRISINRYAGAKDSLEVKALWKEDLRRGYVPGAYWAIMTHPAMPVGLIEEIYGQVHMMAHDAHGDYQRDNRRLANLMEKVAVLEEVIGNERRQHLKEKKALKEKLYGLSEIERQYSDLKSENVKLKSLGHQDFSTKTGQVSLKRQLDKLRRDNASLHSRINELTAQLINREKMLNDVEKSAVNLEETRQHLNSENEELRRELSSLETALLFKMSMSRSCKICEDQNTSRCPGPDLCGKTVLYVGGRQNLIPMYRNIIEKHGGHFLHHDGGLEIARAKLPKMVTSADVVVCPVDCVSHDACNCVKKICKRYRKPYAMMRSSGLSSLTKGLSVVVQ